ncbi:MAG: hypothetical protein IPJ88_17465 [Myxococcales bacterium]|nr:MAG: hypothetical protein IPJ88_17465 [Myxococcales bacterium]
MKRPLLWLVSIVCCWSAVACSETGDPLAVDQPAPDYCPDKAPLGYQMSGDCCARVSNADRLDHPQFRVAGISVNRPAILDDDFIANIIQAFLDQETFNWIIDVQNAAADGPIDIRTGFGIRDVQDNTFSFDTTNPDLAPAPLAAELGENEVSSESFNQTLLLPILDKDVTPGQTIDPSAVLPVDQLKLINVPFSDDRTCIGIRNRDLNVYETKIIVDQSLDTETRLEASEFPVPPGEVEAYVKVDAADDVFVADLNDKLCDIIACELRSTCSDPVDYCGEVARSEWNNPPDSLCDSNGCQRNDSEGDDVNGNGNMDQVCDPATECNAWYLNLYFVAQGVEITN